MYGTSTRQVQSTLHFSLPFDPHVHFHYFCALLWFSLFLLRVSVRRRGWCGFKCVGHRYLQDNDRAETCTKGGRHQVGATHAQFCAAAPGTGGSDIFDEQATLTPTKRYHAARIQCLSACMFCSPSRPLRDVDYVLRRTFLGRSVICGQVVVTLLPGRTTSTN